MLISRRSELTGKYHTREISVTEGQLSDWKSGMLIQQAMSNLSIDDREFIMTGAMPEEWDEMCKDLD
jgi:hypothetical protein